MGGSVARRVTLLAIAALLVGSSAPGQARRRQPVDNYGVILRPKVALMTRTIDKPDYEYQRVFITNDLGRTWREVTPGRFPKNTRVFHFHFATRRDGWLTATNCHSGRGFFFRTRTGGRTWRRQKLGMIGCTPSGFAIDFLNSERGWMDKICYGCKQQRLRQTNDGGVTWGPWRNLPDLGLISFVSRRVGFLVDYFSSYNTLYRTNDAGRSWTRRNFAPPPSFRGARRRYLQPQRTGDQLVMPVLFEKGDVVGVAFYRSADRGWTWRLTAINEVPAPREVDAELTWVTVANRDAWWIATLRERVYVTNNGGETWRSEKAPAAHHQLTAVDERRAWINSGKGDRRLVYRTEDGGRTWEKIHPWLRD